MEITRLKLESKHLTQIYKKTMWAAYTYTIINTNIGVGVFVKLYPDTRSRSRGYPFKCIVLKFGQTFAISKNDTAKQAVPGDAKTILTL